MEEVRKRSYSVIDLLYTPEEIQQMRDGLLKDFKAKGLNLEDYARSTGLKKSAIITIMVRSKSPRPTSLMAIDNYLKSLAK